MEAQLTNSVQSSEKNSKRLKLALAIALLILAIGFYAVVAFTYGRSGVTTDASKVNSFSQSGDDKPVSSPSVALDEPNPNTPMPIESELTYTYPEAYNFQVTYTAANWTVTTEPTNLKKFDPTSNATANNVLTLTSTKNPNDKVEFVFTKTTGNELNGHSGEVCTTDYKVVFEGTRGNADQVIRMFDSNSGKYIYADRYFPKDPGSNTGEWCVWTQQPVTTSDPQDNYYIVNIYTNKDSKSLDEIDNMIKTVNLITDTY